MIAEITNAVAEIANAIAEIANAVAEIANAIAEIAIPGFLTKMSYHFTLITIHINLVETRNFASLQPLYLYQSFCEMVSVISH